MNAEVVKRRINEIEKNPKLFLAQSSKAIEAPRSFDEALTLLLIGRSHLLVGVHQNAIKPLNMAIAYLSENGYFHALFHAHINLGTVYREDKEYYLSMASFEKAIDISYELDHFSYVITALVGLASVYIEIDNLDKAFQYFRKAISYAPQVKGEQILGDLYNNYAFALMTAERFDEALQMFERSKALYQQWYPENNHINAIIVRMNIGETYFRQKEYALSKACYEEALALAERDEIDFLILEANDFLYQITERLGDFKNALRHHKAYVHYKSEVVSRAQNEEVEVMKSTLKETTQKNQNEIHLLRNIALKNKTNALEKTLTNLRTITEVGQKLIASMDMDAIFKILKEALMTTVQVDVFGLALYDEAEAVIVYKYFEERGKKLPELTISIEEGIGLAAYAIQNDTDLLIKNFEVEYPVYVKEIPRIPNSDEQRAKALMYCRLISEEACLGLITMQSYVPNAYTEEDFEIFKALAAYVAIAIANAQKKSIIQKKAEELEYLSYFDPLTDLPNRRAFNRMVKEAHDYPVGILVGDMNNLKRVNDRYGHLVGDQYLMDAAEVIHFCAKPHVAYRLGGDEFAIFVPHADKASIEALIACILQAFSKKSVFEEPFSIALGFAIQDTFDEPIPKLFSRAETQMYTHKRQFHSSR